MLLTSVKISISTSSTYIFCNYFNSAFSNKDIIKSIILTILISIKDNLT